MTPTPLNLALRGTTDVVSLEIVNRDGKLVCEAIWNNGDRCDATTHLNLDMQVETAWEEVLFDVKRAEWERRQAYSALLRLHEESIKESYREW